MIMERRKIEIGERLRREREKAGYSQEAFVDCQVKLTHFYV